MLGSEAPCPWLEIQELPQRVPFPQPITLPPPQNPVDGQWRIHVKNPKFAAGRVPLPFKGNLLTLTPGSCFRTGQKPRPHYGRMLPMSRSGFEKALHYGLAFPAPVESTA